MSRARSTHPKPSFPDDWERRALRAADLGAFVLDAGNGVARLDERAAELLGVSPGEMSLDEYFEGVDASDRARVAEHVKAALGKAGGAYHDEFRTSSRRCVAASGRPRQHDGGAGVLLFGMLSDITLRRTTEDARARLIDEMARALRFSDMLIGLVGKDVQGSLATITRTSEDLGNAPDAASARATVERIRRSVERTTRSIAQLLELTRGRLDGQIPLRLQETELASLARRISTEVATAEPGAGIDVEARGDATATCDVEQVSRVIASLLSNAVRHGADPRRIRVLVDGTDSRSVSITVTNPGVVPRESTPTLFNPFRRMNPGQPSNEQSQGLGFGLYIARRIALGHGGELGVSSSADEGTAFRLDIPRSAASGSFSLTPERGEEEALLLDRLGLGGAQSRVTAALFGVLPVEQRAPEAFGVLVERHVRILELALERQVYRDAEHDLGGELREIAEQLGALGAGAGDVADLHAQALKRAIRGARPLKVQALVSEGRLLALELMGRLVMFYRKRSGFGSLTRARSETS